MSLEVQINNDIKQAMLSKDKPVLESLRAIKSAILLLKTGKEATNGEVAESAEIAMLQKLVKQRREAADIYVQQNRQDLADEELFQASIIERYLPKQLSKEEIEAEVRNIIATVGATSPKDMGKVMGQASKLFAGRADNRVVSEIVKGLLKAQGLLGWSINSSRLPNSLAGVNRPIFGSYGCTFNGESKTIDIFRQIVFAAQEQPPVALGIFYVPCYEKSDSGDLSNPRIAR